jgi:hypothetical protein
VKLERRDGLLVREVNGPRREIRKPEDEMAVEAGVDLQAGEEQEPLAREVASQAEMPCVFGRKGHSLLRHDECERTRGNPQRPRLGDVDLRHRLGLHPLPQPLYVDALGHDRAITEAKVVARRLELLVVERPDRDGS